MPSSPPPPTHQYLQQDDDYIIFTNMVTYYKPRPENGTELITREHYLHIPVTCYLERTQALEESFLPQANLYFFEEVRIQLLCRLM